MDLHIELAREDDGRWIADVIGLPGVMAYGRTRDEALAAVQALALHVLAERLEHGELEPGFFTISFAERKAKPAKPKARKTPA